MQESLDILTLDNVISRNENEDTALKILLIDDDKVDRLNVTRASKKIQIDISVEECEDVESGVSLFQQQPFDCIIIDYRMPVQDGLEGVGVFRQIDKYVPIVMITGQGDESLAVQAMQCGAHHYIPKDRITSETLWNALNNAIENSELKRKLDQQGRELEKFSRVMTCDLKTPMQTIQSFSNLIRQAILDKQYEKVLELYDHIDQSVLHMNELIDTTWNYSKYEGTDKEFETRSMRRILDDTLKNLSTIINEKSAKIAKDTIPYIADDDSSLAEFLDNIKHHEGAFADWSPEQQEAVQHYRKSIEALHKEAIKQIILRMSKELIARDELGATMDNQVVYNVMRRLKLVKPNLKERIEEAFEQLQPMLASHGGGIELVSVQPPDTIEVKFTGNCVHCSSSMITFTGGIRKILQEKCPEIRNIIQVKPPSTLIDENRLFISLISPFSLEQHGAWAYITNYDEIPDGTMQRYIVGDTDLIVYRDNSIINCFDNQCPHTGEALHEELLFDGFVTSRTGNHKYSLYNGECLMTPEIGLNAYPVRIMGNRVEAKI